MRRIESIDVPGENLVRARGLGSGGGGRERGGKKGKKGGWGAQGEGMAVGGRGQVPEEARRGGVEGQEILGEGEEELTAEGEGKSALKDLGSNGGVGEIRDANTDAMKH